MTKRVGAAGLLAGVPPLVQEMPWVQVLDKVYLEMLQKTLGYADNLRIYTQLDNVSEEVLDVLAVQFKVDWYDQTYPVETKRNIIKTALQVRRYYGTDWATETALCSVYPDSKVVEWYEYGGTPGHFKVECGVSDTDEELQTAAIKKIINTYKRTTAHLDHIIYTMTNETPAQLYGGAAFAGYMMETDVNLLGSIENPTHAVTGYIGAAFAGYMMETDVNLLGSIENPTHAVTAYTAARTKSVRQRLTVYVEGN